MYDTLLPPRSARVAFADFGGASALLHDGSSRLLVGHKSGVSVVDTRTWLSTQDLSLRCSHLAMSTNGVAILGSLDGEVLGLRLGPVVEPFGACLGVHSGPVVGIAPLHASADRVRVCSCGADGRAVVHEIALAAGSAART